MVRLLGETTGFLDQTALEMGFKAGWNIRKHSVRWELANQSSESDKSKTCRGITVVWS